MRRDVLGSLKGRPRDLVIDLRRVEQLSNPGLALLVGIRARQRAHHRTLTLVCGSDSSTEQMLSRTGLRGRFTTVTALASNGSHVFEQRKAD
jgi:anti-anti-sigma regulatory factor